MKAMFKKNDYIGNYSEKRKIISIINLKSEYVMTIRDIEDIKSAENMFNLIADYTLEQFNDYLLKEGI